MNNDEQTLLNRRKVLAAALLGGGSMTLAACGSPGDANDPATDGIWAGFDEKITERTLAEAEKLFGLAFSEAERRQILGGAIEEGDDGFFAQQIASLEKRR
jgi:hypothetical protein